MARPVRTPAALGTQQGRSRSLNPSRLVNFYAELAPPGSLVKIVHVGTPGQKPWATVGGDTIRAGIEAQGFAYILSGDTLYRVTKDGTATPCTGDMIPTTGRAMLMNNGQQVGLLVRPHSFVVKDTIVTKVTSPGYPTEGASSIDYIDGFTVWTKDDDTGQFFISAIDDVGTIDPLDFATAESSPDGLVRVLVDHREIWLFGTDTIEPWTDNGTSPMPFERVNGALIEKGCAAAMSPAKLDNSVFWLGSDRIVYRANGYQPVRISTHAIESILETGDISDAFGMSYTQDGHAFYILTLPTLGRTFVFDAAAPDPAMAWHERQSGTSLAPSPWAPTCMFRAFGKTLVGLTGGKVAELDLRTYDDLGMPIRSSVSCPPIYGNGNRAIMRRAELECEMGVGLTAGQGAQPVAMLRISDDGGNTWKPEREAPIGPIGSRRKRAAWTGLGAFTERTLEFAVSDPVKRTIYGIRHFTDGLAN